jgi:hypothetical protein
MFVPFFAVLIIHGFAADAPKTEAAERDYVRFTGDDKRGKLETAIVTMKNDAGVVIDLIGAIHIADAGYYKALNQLFTSYEALLFELVDGQTLKADLESGGRQKRAKGEKDDSSPAFKMIRAMMQGMGSYFRFAYQTDEDNGINYGAKNFVHADVSMDEFLRLQGEKGESFGTIFAKAMEAQFKLGPKLEGDEPKGSQLLLALLGDSSGLKIAMARVLGKVETLGEDLGLGSDSVILGERNRVALEIFDREVKAGRKNLGVFYGAAHLADMETRLEKRGYKRTSERWLTAWEIKPRSEEQKPEPKP